MNTLTLAERRSEPLSNEPATAFPATTLLERLVAGSRLTEDRMKDDWRRVAGEQVAASFGVGRVEARRP